MSVTLGATLYNEESNVSNVVRLIWEVIERFPGDQFVFIDNGSTDDTFIKLLRACQDIQNVRVIQNENTRGYGDGIRRLLKETETENILIFPGDFQFQVNEIIAFRSFWGIERRERRHWSLFSVRERYDGIYQGARGRIWRLFLCMIFDLAFRFDPASQLRVLCLDCIGSLVADDFTIDVEILKKLNSSSDSKQIGTYKAKFTSRNEGKSSIEKGFLITETRVVLACLKLRRRLFENSLN